MSFIDEATGIVNFKIVYYGPGLAGKTANMRYVYDRTAPERRGKMISLATDTDRTLFFDISPPGIVRVDGHAPRIHLYTVPGPVFYDRSRVMILKGADAVVFVADSQQPRAEANVVSIETLESNLALHGIDLDALPFVLQYNKRDWPHAMTVETLDAHLNPSGWQRFEAIAPKGIGVFDSLKAAWRQVVAQRRVEHAEGDASVPWEGPAPRAEPEARPGRSPMSARPAGAAGPASWLGKIAGRLRRR